MPTPTPPRILAFAGSLRAGSHNKKLVAIAAAAAKNAGAAVTLIDLRDYPLPLFDEDLEKSAGLPPNARKLKDLFLAHDALLLACPEYNSSISAVLKNTIDWVSRPAPNEAPLQCFNGKVVALLAASPGGLGGLRGLVTVRGILANIKCLVLPDQFALIKSHEAFTPEGALKDPSHRVTVESIARRLVETTAKLHA